MEQTEQLTRYARLELLKQHFLGELVEDCLDGTPFDIDVLHALENLQNKYMEE